MMGTDAQRVIRGRDLRRAAWALLAAVAVAAAANVPFAVTRMRSRSQPPLPQVTLPTPTAQARWPLPTPHTDPWPAPSSYVEYAAFGYRKVDARGMDPSGQTGLAMEAEFMGWPFPVIAVQQMWWDWNKVAWSGPVPNPAPFLVWSGVLLNPLIVGGGLWLLTVVPVLLVVWFLRAWRRRGGECVECGYPTGSAEVCPERGSPVRPCAG